MNRLTEIEERMTAIKSEIDGADNNKLSELEKEIKDLKEERNNILQDVEQRKALINEVVNNTDATVKKFEEREKEVNNMENMNYTVDSKEYRSAFLKQVRGIELNETEKRAFTNASNSAGAVIPTQTANEIITKIKQYAPLLDEITLLNVTGNVTFAVENSINDATLHTQNSSISASADTLTSVTLGGYEVCKLVQVSKAVTTMSVDAFEGWLVDMLAEKVAASITRYLISGTGSSQPTGVGSITYNTTNSITVGSTASMTATNVQALIGLLPGSFDKNAKFLMSKKTLYTDFMPLQDNAKHPIVTVEGKDYYIYGYPVMLDEDVALHDAYLGDFKKVVGNLSENVGVASAFDINTNSYKYLGSATFDSKIADATAFAKITKATN